MYMLAHDFPCHGGFFHVMTCWFMIVHDMVVFFSWQFLVGLVWGGQALRDIGGGKVLRQVPLPKLFMCFGFGYVDKVVQTVLA